MSAPIETGIKPKQDLNKLFGFFETDTNSNHKNWSFAFSTLAGLVAGFGISQLAWADGLIIRLAISAAIASAGFLIANLIPVQKEILQPFSIGLISAALIIFITSFTWSGTSREISTDRFVDEHLWTVSLISLVLSFLFFVVPPTKGHLIFLGNALVSLWFVLTNRRFTVFNFYEPFSPETTKMFLSAILAGACFGAALLLISKQQNRLSSPFMAVGTLIIFIIGLGITDSAKASIAMILCASLAIFVTYKAKNTFLMWVCTAIFAFATIQLVGYFTRDIGDNRLYGALAIFLLAPLLIAIANFDDLLKFVNDRQSAKPAVQPQFEHANNNQGFTNSQSQPAQQFINPAINNQNYVQDQNQTQLSQQNSTVANNQVQQTQSAPLNADNGIPVVDNSQAQQIQATPETNLGATSAGVNSQAQQSNEQVAPGNETPVVANSQAEQMQIDQQRAGHGIDNSLTDITKEQPNPYLQQNNNIQQAEHNIASGENPDANQQPTAINTGSQHVQDQTQQPVNQVTEDTPNQLTNQNIQNDFQPERNITEQVPVQASPPPNWYPDPAQRFEFRWFDGNSWTNNVATNGVQQVDPQPI